MKLRILNYIKEFGSINTRQAFIDLGCADLQHYIRLLRQDYDIKDKWVKSVNRWNDPVKYKEYFLEEKTNGNNDR